MNLYTAPTLLIAILSFYISFLIFFNNRNSILNLAFTLYAFLISYWYFFDFLSSQASDQNTAYFWMKIGCARYLTFSALTYFILRYTENPELYKNRIINAVILIPALLLTLADIAFQDLITTYPIKREFGYSYSFLPDNDLALYFFLAWYLIIAGICIFAIIRFILRSRGKKKRRRNGDVVITALVPFIFFMLDTQILRIIEYQGLIADILNGLILFHFAYYIWKYNFFSSISPEAAAYNTVNTMKEALLLLSPQGKSVFVNPAFLNLIQLSKSDILGENIKKMSEKGYFDPQAIQNIFKGKDIDNSVLPFKTKRGVIKYGRLSSSYLVDEKNIALGIVCIINDITDLKQIQDNLQEEYNLLKITLASIDDAVIAVDMNSNIILINPMAEKLTGWAKDKAIGKKPGQVLKLIDEKNRLELESPFQRLLEERVNLKSDHGSLLINRLCEEIPIEYSGAPIKSRDDSMYGAVLVLRNISEKRKMRAMLQEAQCHLLQSEKMAGIGQIAAGVAHEINNPMGFINSNLNALQKYVNNIFYFFTEINYTIGVKIDQDNQVAKEIKEKLETIKRKECCEHILSDIPQLLKETTEGAERVIKIITSLNSFAQPANDELSEIDINEEIEKSLSLVWNEIKYHCQVRKYFHDIPPVTCNRGQIGQVFVNLLVNAAQAIEKKEGIITIKTYQEESSINLEFSDNGKGIPSENLNKIFDPFFTTKAVGQGTGLGLSLVYGIITNNQWSLDVDSEVNQGTTFKIKIPLEAEAAMYKI